MFCCVFCSCFVCLFLWSSARMMGLQEDNKSLNLSLSKVEADRKQAQERSNNLEKVSRHFTC